MPWSRRSKPRAWCIREGHPAYRFRPALDLVFDKKERLPGHTNGLQFFAYDADGTLLLRRVYYSIGGGFVVSEAELERGKHAAGRRPTVPYPFANAAEMLAMAASSGLSIAQMKRANEEAADRPEGARRRPRPALGGDGRLHRARAAHRRHHARRAQRQRRAKAIHQQLDDAWQRNEMGPLAGQ